MEVNEPLRKCDICKIIKYKSYIKNHFNLSIDELKIL